MTISRCTATRVIPFKKMNLVSSTKMVKEWLLSMSHQVKTFKFIVIVGVTFDFELYMRMFLEVKKLGEGGFGQVFLG